MKYNKNTVIRSGWRRFILPAVIGMVIGSGSAYASERVKQTVPKISELPTLSAQQNHSKSCNRVSSFFTRSHYKEIVLDKKFAEKVIDSYLYENDRYHSLFTADEVKDMYGRYNDVIAAMSACRLDYPFELYTKVINRKFKRLSYYLSVLDKPVDLNGHDYIDSDRSKLPPLKDMAQLEDLWRKLVVNDLIKLMLNGKTEEKARELLKKRYTNQLRILTESKSEDAFSAFENAYAHAIDPHTSYLSPDDSAKFMDEMSLAMEGIGAVLTKEDDYVKIVSLIPGSPAEMSKKLKPNDYIIGIRQHDGKNNKMLDVVGMRLEDVVPMVKGKKGSKVTLEIQRDNGGNVTTFTVDLVRSRIRLEDSAAKGEVREIDGRKVGVLTVKSFYVNLYEDIDKELKKLNDKKIEALVLDLRYNGGGALSEAILSTGLFVDNDAFVQVRDGVGNVAVRGDVTPGVTYSGPMVVLTNRLSASASEIMAAALQDLGRAVVVGDTTFGKGTVQQSRPLDRIFDYNSEPLGSIHYTIAKFYRINGGSTQMKGVQPDILFPKIISYDIVGEKNEPNALEWDMISSVKYQPKDLKNYISELSQIHENRVKNNELFKDMENAERKLSEEMKPGNRISLNFAERKAEKDNDDAEYLQIINRNLKANGQAPISNIKDLPSKYEPFDCYLDESARIALDLADLEKKNLATVKN